MRADLYPDARILVVDDQPANIRLLQKLLAQAGYTHLETTSDPCEVETLFRSFRPDILLLDLHMPRMDGIEVMTRLRSDISGDSGSYFPVLVLTADATRDAKERALSAGAKDFLTKPFDPTEALLRIQNLLQTRFLHLEIVKHSHDLEATVKARTADLWDAIGDLESTRAELRESQEETVQRLATAAEFRDDETARHIQRMSHYCGVLARNAGLSDDFADLIRVASQMHDVGKLGTPDSILLKPGPLTPEERTVMEQHAMMGYDILANSRARLLQLAASIALTHHERMDGTGYPRGLRGAEIPIEGRVAAVADIFDALTSNRVYREAFPIAKAIDIMKDAREVHLDPRLLDIFLGDLDEIYEIKARFDDEPTELRVTNDEVPR